MHFYQHVFSLSTIFTKNIVLPINLICLWKVAQISENISLKFKTNILQSKFNQYYIQGESKKVWFAALGAKLYLFCATLLSAVFSIFFENFKFFFGTLNGPKKLKLKLKVQKSKNVYIKYFYRNIKFYKDWITESQKFCKISVRNFAIFSSGLIFEKWFFRFQLNSVYFNINIYFRIYKEDRK